MNAFVLIIPIIALLLVSKFVVPPYVPPPRATVSPAEMTPAEIRQRIRAQKWKEAMRVESVTAGDSDP